MTQHHAEAGQQSAADIQDLIEQLIAVLRTRQKEAEATLIAELQSISTYIQSVRTDLSTIGPEVKSQYIPTATDELEAISETTAEATNRIMDAAESIEAMVSGGAIADKAALTAAATRIYEACTFQDLTGQRVRKIVTALHAIEVKIDELIATFSVRLGIAGCGRPQVAALPGDDDGVVGAHGPQLPGIAKTQAEIDALMEGIG